MPGASSSSRRKPRNTYESFLTSSTFLRELKKKKKEKKAKRARVTKRSLDDLHDEPDSFENVEEDDIDISYKSCNMSQPTVQTGTNAVPAPNLPATPTDMGKFISGAGMLKKILSLMAFFMAFMTVMVVLFIYMNNTAMRHYQFQVNMSRDYELLEVKQDDPELIVYIRQMHLRPVKEMQGEYMDVYNDTPAEDLGYVLKLLNNKSEGVFVEAGAYNDGKTSETAWLEKKLNWNGLLIQPDPRHYFNLKKHDRERSQAIHGCLSPSPYPKEVSFHQGDRDGVKINSIHSNSIIDDSDIFNTRVKCFPLYSLLLAMNVTAIDYLCLKTGGTELQVLETIPFDRVIIKVINIHLQNKDVEKDTIKKFLATKNYSFAQHIRESYIFFLNRKRRLDTKIDTEAL
ncbi:protein star [Holotrichia oblita]|uniref:Protein star n=1 Tax=Holotrichia oblita TaxID=644536 RepID=A0ACB9T5R7_HOLOL|nr:protein star [Holotrichia oblita]